MSELISVKDKLPDFTHSFAYALVSDDLFARRSGGEVVVADYSTCGWCTEDGDIINDVTDWKPYEQRKDSEND